ncbi:MAG: L-threonylcarbamoyladenylate synthase [Gemmatimonadales bacterium]
MLQFRTPADVDQAAPEVDRHLRRAGLIGYPTETVYGLGSAPDAEGTAALAVLKGRPQGKPFLLLVSSRMMAEEYGLVFTRSAAALADAFWPGALTLVLRGAEGKLPDQLRGPEGGIAVRYTSHPEVARLIGIIGYPITSTSANRPGEGTAPGAGAIANIFPDAVKDGTLLVLDGGTLGNVPSSTLVDCTSPVPALIREGAIPRPELRRAVGRLAP